MGIERSARHPDSARHLLQLRAYEAEGTRVVLVELTRPRCRTDILSEVESHPLPPTDANHLYQRARLAPIEAVASMLRGAQPRRPRGVTAPARTARLPSLGLTSPGREALTFLLRQAQGQASRSELVDEALQSLARSHGWTSPRTRAEGEDLLRGPGGARCS